MKIEEPHFEDEMRYRGSKLDILIIHEIKYNELHSL